MQRRTECDGDDVGGGGFRWLRTLARAAVAATRTQQALGFAVDEHHVYWAEVTGTTTTFERRPVQ